MAGGATDQFDQLELQHGGRVGVKIKPGTETIDKKVGSTTITKPNPTPTYIYTFKDGKTVEATGEHGTDTFQITGGDALAATAKQDTANAAPDVKNFGTADTPDWRQYDSTTKQWTKIPDVGSGTSGVTAPPVIRDFGTPQNPDWRQWDPMGQRWAPATGVTNTKTTGPRTSVDVNGVRYEQDPQTGVYAPAKGLPTDTSAQPKPSAVSAGTNEPYIVTRDANGNLTQQQNPNYDAVARARAETDAAWTQYVQQQTLAVQQGRLTLDQMDQNLKAENQRAVNELKAKENDITKQQNADANALVKRGQDITARGQDINQQSDRERNAASIANAGTQMATAMLPNIAPAGQIQSFAQGLNTVAGRQMVDPNTYGSPTLPFNPMTLGQQIAANYLAKSAGQAGQGFTVPAAPTGPPYLSPTRPIVGVTPTGVPGAAPVPLTGAGPQLAMPK